MNFNFLFKTKTFKIGYRMQVKILKINKNIISYRLLITKIN